MIEIENLSKSFVKGRFAVDHTTWIAPDGKVTGFIGPNGSGKTTTLKMATGVLKPTTGTVRINGLDIQTQPIEAKRQFGYVSDSPDHFLRLTCMEYLTFMADVYKVPEDDRAPFIDEYSKRFGIHDKLNDRLISYSHGMRQKAMVLGALIHSPSVWILDEPLTGLDPESSFELKKMMREHARANNTVLFSTHVLEVAEKLCDQVVIQRKGKLLFTGSLDELQSGFPSGMTLEEIFLRLVGSTVLDDEDGEADESGADGASSEADEAEDAAEAVAADGAGAAAVAVADAAATAAISAQTSDSQEQR